MTSKKILHKWEDLQEDYKDCLLIGNGASIAFNSQFVYDSLYEEAINRKIISDDAQKVFAGFNVKDFEKVLELVSAAQAVNSALEIQDNKTADVYKNVQNGLISIVQAIHPDQREVVSKLEKAAVFSRQFSTILSLNYDLILYWMITYANEENPKIKFKDCFSNSGNIFHNDWRELKSPYRKEEKSILCFYPHGNLSLVTLSGEETKVTVKNSEDYLLDAIVKKWKQGYYQPLYVSEGTPEQKLTSIKKSSYLREIYNNVLPDVGKTLVIYGSSLQETDGHIFRTLGQGRISKIAVSMYNPKDFEAESAEIEYKLKRHNKNQVEICFFDSESKGAWIY